MKCFVIMPFADMDSIFEFYTSICESFSIECYRIDSARHSKPGNISAEIMREIKLADIIIADTSHNNPNVFYELGFAHSLSLENVIITRQEKDGRLPFDIQGARTIFYDIGDLTGMTKAQKSIQTFIKNIVSRKYSPSVSINAFYKSISEREYKEAWGHLSRDFKVRRWNNSFRTFEHGFRHTHSISHLKIDEVTNSDHHAKFHISYIEEVDAPSINELHKIGRRTLGELNDIHNELQHLYDRLYANGFSKEEIQGLTLFQAVCPNRGQILSWLLQKKHPENKSPDAFLGSLNVSRAHYCYEVSLSETKGQWFISKIRPIATD